jgi:hypothetical protein
MQPPQRFTRKTQALPIKPATNLATEEPQFAVDEFKSFVKHWKKRDKHESRKRGFNAC